jgi:DNA-binding transcriptional ArsR family regulator
MSIPTTTSDVFVYQSRDPHTAIPDWIPFRSDITAEARILALAILVLSKGLLPPAIPEIAERMGVDERTVYRWLNELRSQGVLTTELIGRRNFYRFHESTPDRLDHLTHGSGDRGDQVTHGSGDPCVRGTPPNPNQFSPQQNALNSGFSENPISDPSVGVGVGQHVGDSDPTTNNRAPLKTALARWLKRAGMNAAREFDDPALDYATYREFVEYKRGLGWEWRQIVSTLREAPLEPQPCDPLANDWYSPEQLADGQADELHQLDSTSMALTRRFEADKAEAAARARGELT